LVVDIASDRGRFVLREGERKMWVAENAEWLELDLAIPLQSELTRQLVGQLLASGDCALTPYARSAELHLPLIEALMMHLSDGSGTCPIT
jgi:hypothetical protein